MSRKTFRLGVAPDPDWGTHRPHTPSCMYPQTVLFDVLFPEKLLKIVATIGEIFSLKFTKYRLVAGLRPNPLGELNRSADLLWTCESKKAFGS